MADVGHRTLRSIASGGEGSPAGRSGEASGLPTERGGQSGSASSPMAEMGGADSAKEANDSFEHRTGLDAPELMNMGDAGDKDPRPVPASAANAQYNNVPGQRAGS